MAIDSIAIQTAETISGFQYKIDSINPKSILCPGPKHPNKLPTNDEDIASDDLKPTNWAQEA